MSKPKTKNPAKQPPAETQEEEEAENAVIPEVCFDHDQNGYLIDIELPGVKKEQIDLSIGQQSLCIEAPRSDGEIVYLGCFALVHPVDQSKAEAKYDNGLLKLTVPFKAPIKSKRIPIE